MCKALRFLLLVFITALAPGLQALTDPTQPSYYRDASKKQSLHLESILFGENRRVAVINGKALTEGDRIGSAKIISITKDNVKLKRSGELFTLQLQRITIRQENK